MLSAEEFYPEYQHSPIGSLSGDEVLGTWSIPEAGEVDLWNNLQNTR
jgi:hypothetical protein